MIGVGPPSVTLAQQYIYNGPTVEMEKQHCLYILGWIKLKTYYVMYGLIVLYIMSLFVILA